MLYYYSIFHKTLSRSGVKTFVGKLAPIVGHKLANYVANLDNQIANVEKLSGTSA